MPAITGHSTPSLTAPVSDERKQEILSDERVQAAQPRVDAGKAGGRVRGAEETDEITAVEDVSIDETPQLRLRVGMIRT